MSNHIFTYFEVSNMTPTRHYARCTCGHVTDRHVQKQVVEDETMKHLEYIERVKAHLGTRNPSLKSQRDYYRDQAENGTPELRRLWKQLADELSDRLGDNAPKWEQPPLIDLD